jgi:hypothetical protein
VGDQGCLEDSTKSLLRREAKKRQPTRTSTEAPSGAKITNLHHWAEDSVLHGFLSSVPTCRIERKQLALRLRTRLMAVDLAIAGERRFTLPEIAELVGTSTRTRFGAGSVRVLVRRR